ncbi:hypothetical protein G6O67_008697 [Ophiocordyceps sinensis]|uniref:Uncharacterized protein n=1 Tax=Ophiocordyceps sinensis TaxID=72228 RepID=A0A8H4PIJ2_9HYPO|nr:hypothetical protein G6O67_008697 [Ophiocordyceps sinensis]
MVAIADVGALVDGHLGLGRGLDGGDGDDLLVLDLDRVEAAGVAHELVARGSLLVADDETEDVLTVDLGDDPAGLAGLANLKAELALGRGFEVVDQAPADGGRGGRHVFNGDETAVDGELELGRHLDQSLDVGLGNGAASGSSGAGASGRGHRGGSDANGSRDGGARADGRDGGDRADGRDGGDRADGRDGGDRADGRDGGDRADGRDGGDRADGRGTGATGGLGDGSGIAALGGLGGGRADRACGLGDGSGIAAVGGLGGGRADRACGSRNGGAVFLADAARGTSDRRSGVGLGRASSTGRLLSLLSRVRARSRDAAAGTTGIGRCLGVV